MTQLARWRELASKKEEQWGDTRRKEENVGDRPSLTTANGDAVAADLQSVIVMDDLCEALVSIDFQVDAVSVSDVWKCSGNGLVRFDHLKGEQERDLSGPIKEVLELVEGVIHQAASLVHRRRRHVYPVETEL